MYSPYKIRRLTTIFIFLVLMGTLGLNYFSLLAYGKPPSVSSNFHIETEFILWLPNEKMIDDNFDIHLYCLNETNNNTAYYKITIDNTVYNNTFQYYTVVNHTVNTDYISLFKIEIDNITLLEAKDIFVITGVNAQGIKRSTEAYTISLSPLQWNAKERNIAFSIFTASLISIMIGYRVSKFYRKRYGIKIKDGN